MSDRQDPMPGTQPAAPRATDPGATPPPPQSGPDDRPTHRVAAPTDRVAAPTGAGATAVGADGAPIGAGPTPAPDYSPRPVAVRRPDTLGALLLLLAGLAAGFSLLLRWLEDDDATGLDLVQRGFDDLGQGIGEVFDTGFWQPMTVILGGALLFVLAFLLFVPGRRHRFVGVVALVVSLLMTAAVLVPLWRADWDLGTFDLGFWFAIAAAALGLLGSLKALLTGRKYASEGKRG